MGRLRHGVDPFDCLNRIWALRNERFDVVHCVASRPTVFYPGLFMRKAGRCPTLIYEWEDSFSEGGVALEMRGALYDRLFGWIEKYYEEKLAKCADGVIVVSDFLKKRAVRLGVDGRKILKQIKGMPEISLDLPEKNWAKKQVLGRNRTGPVFTYVGSIYDADLSLLFRAFEEVSRAHSNIRLRLLGYNRKRSGRIPNNVTILPRIPEEEYRLNLAATDVFVLPLKCSTANISRYPSKFGDYIAAGKPVVATPLPEIKRIIDRGRCGYVAEGDSVEAFGNAMLTALGDRKNRELLGRNGKEYAERHLYWRRIASNVIEFYDRMRRN